MASTPQYRPGGVLLTVTTVLMGSFIALTVISIGSDALEWRLLSEIESGPEPTPERIEASDLRQAAIGFVYTGLYLVLAIAYLRSLYVLNRNARALGADDMSTSPGWTVGWFFVPIASLFKPFQAVRDLWKASVPTAGRWQENRSSPIVGWWWAFYLISAFFGQATFRTSLSAETIDQFQIASGVSIAGGLFDLPLSVLAILLLRRLFSMQEEKYARYGESSATEPACPACGEVRQTGDFACPVCGHAFA
ncbi:MAG: DUF4328 domain-containing protein [Planctomycetaceae bacterium]